MNEGAWKSWVIDYAMWHKWRVCHVRPAQTEKGWRTPYEGHSGLPDLILARCGVVLLVELKSDTGRAPTPDQVLWINAAGQFGYVWRPRDRPIVEKILH